MYMCIHIHILMYIFPHMHTFLCIQKCTKLFIHLHIHCCMGVPESRTLCGASAPTLPRASRSSEGPEFQALARCLAVVSESRLCVQALDIYLLFAERLKAHRKRLKHAQKRRFSKNRRITHVFCESSRILLRCHKHSANS